MGNENLIDDNYSQEKITINIIWANIFGFIVFIAALGIFGVLFVLLWREKITEGISFSLIPSNGNFLLTLLDLPVFLLIFAVGIILHEGIHGLFFAINSRDGFKSVKFGILPKEKLFTPYCHCEEKLKTNHYRLAALMPMILLGIIPSAIALIIGNMTLLLWGVLFITAGCGDLLMVMKLIKEKNDVLVYDLPDDAGFIVYRPK